MFNSNILLPLLVAWLVIGLCQALHFHYYFDQSWLRSFVWSYRDWLLWVLIAYAFYLSITKLLLTIKNKSMAFFLLTVSAFFAGLIQVFLIILTGYIFTELSRPFWEDFLHLYQKRWFQNLFIFAVLWVFMHLLFTRAEKRPTTPVESESSNTKSRIKVIDGTQYFWLDPKNIYRIEVTGNYICFFTNEGQKIARKTMKSMEQQLDNHGFLKISRSNLINTRYIKGITKSGTNTHVELSNGDTCKISRRYWNKIKNNLNTLLT